MTRVTHYFCGHSLYAYLGFGAFLELAQEAKVQIEHKPMDLHKVMEAAGSSPFEVRRPEQLRYFFGIDATRWAQYRGVATMGHIPTHHMKSYDPVNKLLISAQTRDADIGPLALGLLTAHWNEDADLTDNDVFVDALRAAGQNDKEVLDLMDSEEIEAIYAQNTQSAIEAGVMGSPTYFVDDEMFYGQDRLELLAWRLSQRVNS